jgi:predicted amidohydrolase
VRVAALQFDVRRGESAANLSEVERGLRRAASERVELVVLPEMWPSSFPGPRADLARLVDADRASWERVELLSAELGLAVCGSGFGAVANDKPANRWVLLDRGARLAEYDKAHLFSPTAETESFSGGRALPRTVSLRSVRTSGCICYDVRFPELTRRCFLDEAQLLCIPTQWPATRASHFRALMIGLAVTNQCFVIACNRTGTDVIGRRELVLDFPGRSLVIDPNGTVLAEGSSKDELVLADIEPERASEMRRTVPVERDRRPDVYSPRA